jgi:hypothetical protein
MEFKNVKIFPLTWHTKSSSLKREMPPYVAFFSSPYFPHLPDSGDILPSRINLPQRQVINFPEISPFCCEPDLHLSLTPVG